MTIQEQKAKLRQKIKKQSESLEAEYLAYSNHQIRDYFLAMPDTKNAEIVFCYISVGTEPDTRILVQHLLASGKRVCVPRCEGKGIMDARYITSLDELRPASMGLWEPGTSLPLANPHDFNLAILPCVAADASCWRLGHGGGYYDRYLAAVSCPTICFCRGRLLQKQIPIEAFDLPASMVITEQGIFYHKKTGGKSNKMFEGGI